MVKKVVGKYQVNETKLIKCLKKVCDLFERFKDFDIMHVPREHNFREDMLSKISNSKKTEFNHTVIQ